MNYKLDSNVGNNFSEVAKEAKQISKQKKVTVEFDFNGITCLVNKTTNLDWLWRDYSNSHRMDWGTIGADCVSEYDDDTKAELYKRNVDAEKKAEKDRKEWKRKEDVERKLFSEKVKGIKIELTDVKVWDKTVKTNSDPYGKAAVDYAEGWAKLMQIEITKGKTVVGCAEKTSHELGFLGITGFMYGCAVGILSRCWKHGEELRKWHNKDYGHDGDGVVNPAILTISK